MSGSCHGGEQGGGGEKVWRKVSAFSSCWQASSLSGFASVGMLADATTCLFFAHLISLQRPDSRNEGLWLEDSAEVSSGIK